MGRKGHRFLACSAILSLVSLGTAQASVFVRVFQNDLNSVDAGSIPPLTLPTATFVSPDINFNTSNSDGITLRAFLNNPVFTNPQNGFNPDLSANNIFLEINGQTFLNAGANSFVVGHDDGVVLSFSNPGIGTVVNQPGPTSFALSPFSVSAPAAGLYSFTLTYGECCGGPANLVFQINGSPVGITPEPPYFGLLAAAAAGVALLRRRSLRQIS